MYILNITKPIKKMSINSIKDFIFENYYKWIGFSKKNSYDSIKPLKNIFVVVRNNGKNTYQSFIRKNNTKSVKQPKMFENLNIIDIKSIIKSIQKLHINYSRL